MHNQNKQSYLIYITTKIHNFEARCIAKYGASCIVERKYNPATGIFRIFIERPEELWPGCIAKSSKCVKFMAKKGMRII